MLGAIATRLGHLLVADPVDRAPWGILRTDEGGTMRLLFPSRRAQPPCQRLLALNKVIAVLRTAHTVCRAEQIPLLVVFAPEKFRVYRDHCTFRPDNPCAGWVLDDLPRQLGARIAALGPGIDFLDLTPALAAQAARGRLLYFADDTHWSAAGHETAGQAIAAYVIRQRPLVAAIVRGRDRDHEVEAASPSAAWDSRTICFK
jgi:hypothetical protein